MSVVSRPRGPVLPTDDSPWTETAAQDWHFPLDLVHVVRLFTGLALIGWSVLWWTSAAASVTGPVMTFASLVGGLTVIGLSVTPHGPVSWRKLDRWIMVFTLIVTGMWLAVRSSQHIYQTDEVTTGQASAAVVLAGHDPYSTDLTQELKRFALPPEVSTPLLTGGSIHSTSYPALSFLFYVPFGAILGVGSPFALVADGFAWIVLMVLLWRLLDERLRPIVPLIASFPFYLSFVDGGVTDVVYLPVPDAGDASLGSLPRPARASRLALARTCLSRAGLQRQAHPVADGPVPGRRGDDGDGAAGAQPLAQRVAVHRHRGRHLLRGQRPVHRHGRRRVGARHAAAIAQPLVPFGQGIAMLPVYLHIAGGHVSYLGIAGIAAMLPASGPSWRSIRAPRASCP